MSNEAFNAQLSALIDNELRKDEALFLTRRLVNDPDAAMQLGRYVMIGDAIRRQLPEVMDTRLVERVRAALEAEPALEAAPASSAATMRRILRPLAGLGVAASVAMVGVVYWAGQSSGPTQQQPQALVAAGAAQPVKSASFLPQSQNHQWNRLDPDVQKRLQGYLVNHSEHASTGQLGGVLNHVRIAAQQQQPRD